MNKEQRIRTRDNRLLRKEKSYRRARAGAILFLVLSMIFAAEVFLERPEIEQLAESDFYTAVSVLFWLIVVDSCNMRIRHIDSIKLYRKEAESNACPV